MLRLTPEMRAVIRRHPEGPIRVEGSFLDLSHAACMDDRHLIVMNDQLLLTESKFIFHCAGPSIPLNTSRLSVVRESVNMTTKRCQFAI